MFPFPALLSRPPSLGRRRGEENGLRKGRGKKDGKGATKKERVPCIRVSGCFSHFFHLLLANTWGKKSLFQFWPALKIFQNIRKNNIFESLIHLWRRIDGFVSQIIVLFSSLRILRTVVDGKIGEEKNSVRKEAKKLERLIFGWREFGKAKWRL